MQSRFSDPPQLRTLVHKWLSGLRNAVISNANGGPYPNYPLPPGFPYCGTMIQERFQWNENNLYHDYTVFWQFHQDLESPARWTLTTDNIIIAQVDVDVRLRSGNFALGMDLVIHAMLTSVKHSSPVRISSRPSRSMRNLTPSNRPHHGAEVVEMQFNNGHVVRELFRLTIG